MTVKVKPATDTPEPPETVSIPKGKRANVRTTISYEAELQKETEAENNNKAESEIASPFLDVPFRPFRPNNYLQHKGSNMSNTLASFFDALASDGEENYLVMITRLPDMPSENFNRPQVLYPANFPPMQCNSSALPSFIQEIQKVNGMSGGRFNVRACKPTGESIEDAELTNFVVPDPPRREYENPTQNNNNEMLSLFERLNAENNARFDKMLESLKPQENELEKIAKQVLIKKLLDDDKPPAANLEQMMMQMFMMPSMVEVYAEKMRDAMSAGSDKDNSPTWMKLLESPFGQSIGERIGTITENLSHLAVVAASAKAQEANLIPPQAPQTATAPVVANPTNSSEEKDEMTELIEDIFDELENGEPFNDNNQFLQDLGDDYPFEARFVKTLCESEDFSTLMKMLAEKAPQLFNGFSEPNPTTGEPMLTPRGELLVNRLQEFYLYMRGELAEPASETDVQTETKPETETETLSEKSNSKKSSGNKT